MQRFVLAVSASPRLKGRSHRRGRIRCGPWSTPGANTINTTPISEHQQEHSRSWFKMTSFPRKCFKRLPGAPPSYSRTNGLLRPRKTSPVLPRAPRKKKVPAVGRSLFLEGDMRAASRLRSALILRRSCFLSVRNTRDGCGERAWVLGLAGSMV